MTKELHPILDVLLARVVVNAVLNVEDKHGLTPTHDADFAPHGDSILDPEHGLRRRRGKGQARRSPCRYGEGEPPGAKPRAGRVRRERTGVHIHSLSTGADNHGRAVVAREGRGSRRYRSADGRGGVVVSGCDCVGCARE